MTRGHTMRLGATALAILVASYGHGQSAVDPSDRLYAYLAIWQAKGYITPLPLVRPYPLPIVAEALGSVIQRGTTEDADLAARLADKLGIDAPISQAGATMGMRGKDSAVGGDFGAVLRSQGSAGIFSYSAAFRYWWDSTFSEDLGLQYLPDDEPTFSGAGPDFSLGSETFEGLEDIRLWAALSLESAYVIGGFTRQAFGPFHGDGVVIGERAPPTAQVSLVIAGSTLTYTASLFELVAQVAALPTGELQILKEEFPDTGFPSKYYAMHSLTWHPVPGLSLGGVQGSLFGGRLSLYSLLPTAFITEPFVGDHDNAFAGVYATARLPANFQTSLVFHVDDYQLFDTISGFNPSPFANKVAAQAGVTWTPSHFPASVTLHYTFIAPFTYTHSAHTQLNYLTFTHRGQSFGSSLPPNSDRIALGFVGSLVNWLELTGDIRFIRHGNGSDHGSGSVDGDGSIWDDGYTPERVVTFHGEPTFLNQTLLEQVFQVELHAIARLDWGDWHGTISAGYALELTSNGDLVAGNDRLDHLIKLSAALVVSLR